jgi:alpha/beta superfamily hydrolase
VALVAHPHPLYGGTMDNKVAVTLMRTFVNLGYVVARINFRGVGASEGVHDHGGETDDMAMLHAWMTDKFPGLPVALSGFSFGTYVQSHLPSAWPPPARRPSAWCWSARARNGRWPTSRPTPS